MPVVYVSLCGQQVFSELRREARELVIEDEAMLNGAHVTVSSF
jgi:hypothetical protein